MASIVRGAGPRRTRFPVNGPAVARQRACYLVIPPMPRYFRLEQARALLPGVEQDLRLAMQGKKALALAEAAWREFQKNVQMMGGVQINPARVAELKSRREECIAVLRDALDAITTLGVEVKDLDTGLIDFPTLYQGQEVLLCWQLGEADIEFWHDLTSGFRGRKLIDADFLERHRGDTTC
jgi:hypothetical protein